MVRSVSMGTRQTRKERRARRRRAELRKSASAVLREPARMGRNTLRQAASTVLSVLITMTHTLARGVGRPAGIVLRGSSRAGRNLLTTVVHASSSDAVRDSLLFVALLGSSAAVVASVLADNIELAMLFCLLTLILCAALWVSGLVSRRGSSVDRAAREEERG
jgi:hypothetical protein